MTSQAVASDARERLTVERADIDRPACPTPGTIHISHGVPAVMAQRMVGDHSGGEEGFVSILKAIPDLVSFDINLPAMSGFELLERLVELRPRLGLLPPFLFVTALSDRDNELRARRLGADDFITKPIDFDILEMVIRLDWPALPAPKSNQNWES